MRQYSLDTVQGLRAFVLTLADQGRICLLLALLITSSALTGCQPAEEGLSPEEHFERALLAIEQNDNPEVAVHLMALQDAPDSSRTCTCWREPWEPGLEVVIRTPWTRP